MSRGAGKYLLLLGLFGAALLYADGMITPAISVLSAVEGLHVATPLFDPYVVPLAIAILIGLFLFQSRGTTGVGQDLRPGHDAVVSRDQRARRAPDRARAGGAGRDQSAARRRLFPAQRSARLRGSRRGLPRRHRRRSALCRHRALRHGADPADLVRCCAPGADPELFRPGRASSAQPESGGESVLTAWPRPGRFIRWCCSPRPRP